MLSNRSAWRVQVTFVATPPTRAIARASGVADVYVAGNALRCVVRGSFQPFLEALRGSEVIGLSSIPVWLPYLPTQEGATE